MKEKITKEKPISVNKNRTVCPYCNKETERVWVHGHYQCKLCKTVMESCCEGGEIND